MDTPRLIYRLQTEQPQVRAAINWARHTARRYPPGVGVTVHANDSQVGAVALTFWGDEAGKLHMRTRHLRNEEGTCQTQH